MAGPLPITSIAQLEQIAAGLLSDDGENVEYDRAVAELLTEAAGKPMDTAPETLSYLRDIRAAM